LCRFQGGDRVRVIGGQFVGVEGRVARVAGEQRVVVELQGVCLFATAYVPSAFLQKI
jgi:transcription antitermination factor NusG